MLQKTTTFATLGLLAAGVGAALSSGPEPRPLVTPSDDLAMPMAPIDSGIQPRVSTALGESAEAERWYAAPGGGGAAPPTPTVVQTPVRLAMDEALRPVLSDALRAIGAGLIVEDDSPRGDPVLRLLNGRVDAAFAAREPSPGERRRGVAEERVGDLVLALVAHADNPVGNLPHDMLRQLLRGTITDWSRLGGRPGAIHLVLPPPGAQSDLYAKILMRGDALPTTTFSAATEEARLRMVANDPAALTVVSLEAAGAVSAPVMRIDGVAPSLGAHRLGRYPFGSPVMFVHRGGAAAIGLLTALRGNTAQNILAAHLALDGR